MYVNSCRWRIRDDWILLFRTRSRPQSSCYVTAQDFNRPLGMQSRNADPCESSSRCVVLVSFQERIVSQCQMALLELERRDMWCGDSRARNQIASDALADGFQETLWIDSDVGFDPDDVERIRKHGLPIVCGIYPKKGKRELAIHILPGTPRLRFGIHGGLHELLYGGTGFLHVRRPVYETMIEQLGLPVCNEHANRPMFAYWILPRKRFLNRRSCTSPRSPQTGSVGFRPIE